MMKTLNTAEKEKYLTAHLTHRMTLLRTLRERLKKNENFQGRGDIYRCVKDANLMAVRLLMDFMGLQGVHGGATPTLQAKKRNAAHKFDDDVLVEQFIGRPLIPDDVPAEFREVLAGVYCRADKELAHLTTTFDDAFNTEAKLVEAATAIEGLLDKHLFKPLGFQLPAVDE